MQAVTAKEQKKNKLEMKNYESQAAHLIAKFSHFVRWV